MELNFMPTNGIKAMAIMDVEEEVTVAVEAMGEAVMVRVPMMRHRTEVMKCR